MAERLYPNITLFVEIFLFLIIFLILSKYLFTPVLRILAERRKRIEGEREDALKLKDRTKVILEDYNVKLTDAKRQAMKIIEGFKKDGENKGKELIDAARAVNDKYFNETKQKIWADVDNLKEGLNSTAEEVSNDLASKILQ